MCLSSSVNAIGAFYSRNPRYDYFPVDEDHPCYAEDAYSLSKWAAEEQGRAFAGGALASTSSPCACTGWSTRALQTWLDQSTGRSDHDRKDLWGYTPMRMAVEAALNAVLRDFAGAEVVYVVADDTWSSLDSEQLARDHYPDVPLRQPMGGRRSFYDSAKYNKLLASAWGPWTSTSLFAARP